MNLQGVRITRLADCVGKTIEGFVEDYNDSFGFRFTDGSWIYVTSHKRWGIDDTEFVLSREFDDPREALNLGVITKEEELRVIEAREAKTRARALAEYEYLKAKFEKEGQ